MLRLKLAGGRREEAAVCEKRMQRTGSDGGKEEKSKMNIYIYGVHEVLTTYTPTSDE